MRELTVHDVQDILGRGCGASPSASSVHPSHPCIRVIRASESLLSPTVTACRPPLLGPFLVIQRGLAQPRSRRSAQRRQGPTPLASDSRLL